MTVSLGPQFKDGQTGSLLRTCLNSGVRIIFLALPNEIHRWIRGLNIMCLFTKHIKSSRQELDEEHQENSHQRNPLCPVITRNRAGQAWRCESIRSRRQQLQQISIKETRSWGSVTKLEFYSHV
jgi:hypothetical protein